MNSLISWFARNRVVANLVMFVIVAAGAITLTDLKKEVFPEFSLDMITVEVVYRGAAPEEVEEEAVCVRIEEAVQGIDGIKKMTSTRWRGQGKRAHRSSAGIRCPAKCSKTSRRALTRSTLFPKKPSARSRRS